MYPQLCAVFQTSNNCLFGGDMTHNVVMLWSEVVAVGQTVISIDI